MFSLCWGHLFSAASTHWLWCNLKPRRSGPLLLLCDSPSYAWRQGPSVCHIESINTRHQFIVLPTQGILCPDVLLKRIDLSAIASHWFVLDLLTELQSCLSFPHLKKCIHLASIDFKINKSGFNSIWWCFEESFAILILVLTFLSLQLLKRFSLQKLPLKDNSDIYSY